MRILHTSDWHLGAKIEGKDRFEEQQNTLDEIVNIAFLYDVQIVIVAGDIFHSKTPSSEAEDLFYKTVERLSDNGNRLVFVLSGNHDDPLRLGAGRPLAEKLNIILASELDAVSILKTKVDSRVRVIDAGESYVKVKSGEELTTIGYLPFLSNQQACQITKAKYYREGIAKICKKINNYFGNESFNLFVSHLFLSGGRVGDNKEIRVGEALAVCEEDLPQNSHYNALGHLHTKQKIGEKSYYSGATIALRAKDGKPQVNVITGDKNGLIEVKSVELKSAKMVKEIAVPNIAFAYKEVFECGENCFVYLTINQNLPLKADELRSLRAQFPNIVSVRLNITGQDSVSMNQTDFSKFNDRDLFVEFYKSIYNATPPEELVDLFLECREEQNASD